jgi:hypothetical protein
VERIGRPVEGIPVLNAASSDGEDVWCGLKDIRFGSLIHLGNAQLDHLITMGETICGGQDDWVS